MYTKKPIKKRNSMRRGGLIGRVNLERNIGNLPNPSGKEPIQRKKSKNKYIILS
jgi:hypothetical protein